MIMRTIVLLLVLACALPVDAQTQTRRRVAPGEVTGLEMGIEGTLSVVPGGRLRWFITLYEVVGHRDLRPSAGSTVRATASHARGEPLTVVTTDALGRAMLELAIPEDLEAAPHLRLEAISPRDVRRVFEVELSLAPRYGAELYVDRNVVAPGATVIAFGRVIDRARGTVGVGAGHEVQLVAEAVGTRITLSTDAAGVFHAPIMLGTQSGTFQVQAFVGAGATATRSVDVYAPASEPLVVHARADRPIASPEETLAVDIVVRTPEGLPVAGAEVGFSEQAHLPEEERSTARTDRAGRARLPWQLPRSIDSRFIHHAWVVRAAHPAHGAGTSRVSVRIARAPFFAAAEAEGGALVPGLAGRVFVRLVGRDGRPLANRPIAFDAPRFSGRASATTDAAGVATITGTLQAAPADDRCGGSTFAAAEVELDGHREMLCLKVDPDATLAVRANMIDARRVRIDVQRRSDIGRAPVVVHALDERDGFFFPAVEVLIAADASHAELELPAEMLGEVWLRARAIFQGRAIRGGGTQVWVGGAPPAFTVGANARSVQANGIGSDTLAVFALEPERAAGLRSALDGFLGPVAAALAVESSYAAMLLAERTPTDTSVSTSLRDGELVVLPLPDEPVNVGLLRDPWRTRARFVRGRIGRMMHAVEDYVSARLPDELANLAVQNGRGWRFNTEILEGAIGEFGVGDEGAASLDGEPLEIDALRSMDPAFTYDNVARRITRERLWRVSLLLRTLVRERQLDRPWARRGDPTQYVVAMLEAEDVQFEEAPERKELFDGWGTALALRPVRGRTRSAFLDPVPGYELVSAGPDRRLGTGDDLADPFARVLPSSGIYAEAVGEDALLARLSGVVLGRATVDSLSELFEIPSVDIEELGGDDTSDGDELPPPIAETSDSMPRDPILQPLGGVGAAEQSWTLPPERRRYEVVAVRFSESMAPSHRQTELVAGAPYALRAELPSVMHPGDELTIPIALMRLEDTPEPSIDVSSANGALRVRREGELLHLIAARSGMAEVRLRVHAEGHDEWTHRARIRIVPVGRLRSRHQSALLRTPGELSAPVPNGARLLRSRLVLVAPRGLDLDPMLEPLRESSPAPFAWARAMRGQAIDAELLTLLRRPQPGDALQTACALSAWATVEDEASRVAPLARHLTETVSDDLGERASVLVALASSVPGLGAPADDPIAVLAARLRLDGWRALATASDRPSVMARMAAALLIIDRRDTSARALLQRARAALARDGYGRVFVPGDPERTGDEFIGTLALAIAARQIGDDALADELGSSAAQRLYLAARNGAEGAFWAIAAGVYGAFGLEAPRSVSVQADGATRRVDVSQGRAELPLGASARVSITTAGPILARVETRFVSLAQSSEGATLRAHIEGTPGGLADRSGLELVVGGAGAPVVEISLPAGARFDEEARNAMESPESVLRVVGPDAAGVLRVVLAPLREGAEHRVALPWRWIAAGRMQGLDIAAYDASRPWQIAVSEGRVLEIER